MVVSRERVSKKEGEGGEEKEEIRVKGREEKGKGKKKSSNTKKLGYPATEKKEVGLRNVIRRKIRVVEVGRQAGGEKTKLKLPGREKKTYPGQPQSRIEEHNQKED
jgi:hypothetical protein